MAQIEQRQLEGLVFRTSKRKDFVEDGRKKVVTVPVERALRPGDILAQTEHDSFTRIVTKDGKKYDIPRSKSKPGKGKESPKGSGDAGSPEGGAQIPGGGEE
jgi:hypothetical protein